MKKKQKRETSLGPWRPLVGSWEEERGGKKNGGWGGKGVPAGSTFKGHRSKGAATGGGNLTLTQSSGI